MKDPEEILEQLCILLGKQKENLVDDPNAKKAPKFDPVKRLEELIKSHDKWKHYWVSQHTATGLAYWAGYKDGYDDREASKPRLLESRLRSRSALEDIIEKSPAGLRTKLAASTGARGASPESPK